MGRTYEDYRMEIEVLDKKIGRTADKNERLDLIDKNIALNESYIRVLKKPIPGMIVWCVLLSFLALLGLFIFLPQIITRSSKAHIAKTRIKALNELKEFEGTQNNSSTSKKQEIEELSQELKKMKKARALLLTLGLIALILGIILFIVSVINEEVFWSILTSHMVIAGIVILSLRDGLYSAKVKSRNWRVQILSNL